MLLVCGALLRPTVFQPSGLVHFSALLLPSVAPRLAPRPAWYRPCPTPCALAVCTGRTSAAATRSAATMAAGRTRTLTSLSGIAATASSCAQQFEETPWRDRRLAAASFATTPS